MWQHTFIICRLCFKGVCACTYVGTSVCVYVWVWLYHRRLIVADLCDVWIEGLLWQLMVDYSVKDRPRWARQRLSQNLDSGFSREFFFTVDSDSVSYHGDLFCAAGLLQTGLTQAWLILEPYLFSQQVLRLYDQKPKWFFFLTVIPCSYVFCFIFINLY